MEEKWQFLEYGKTIAMCFCGYMNISFIMIFQYNVSLYLNLLLDYIHAM
jgi:hypothetical protein